LKFGLLIGYSHKNVNGKNKFEGQRHVRARGKGSEAHRHKVKKPKIEYRTSENVNHEIKRLNQDAKDEKGQKDSGIQGVKGSNNQKPYTRDQKP